MTIKNARRAKITHLLQIPSLHPQRLHLLCKLPQHPRVIISIVPFFPSCLTTPQVLRVRLSRSHVSHSPCNPGR